MSDFGESHHAAQCARQVGNAVDVTVKVLHHILHGLQ